MKVFGWAVLIAAALSPTAVCWSAPDLIVSNVTVIDGTGAPARLNTWVEIADGRITRPADRPISGPKRVIDGTGKFLIPGLIDVHIHLKGGGAWGDKPAPDVARGKDGLHAYIKRGVTAIFDAGNAPEFIYGLRAQERAGEIVSPRIFTTGQMVGTAQFRGAAPGEIAPWPEIEKRLDRFVASEPDLLKFSFERFGAAPGEVIAAVPLDTIRRTVAYVRAKGMRTTIHITDEVIAATVVAAGMSTLEHPVVTTPISDEFARILADQRIPFATTLSIFDELKTMMWPEWTAPMRAQTMTNVRKIVELGGIAVVGSDHFDPAMVHREIRLIGETGLPPLTVIRIATLNGAIFLDREKEFGSIEVGKLADMVLLNADPLIDLGNLERIDAVFKAGVEIE